MVTSGEAAPEIEGRRFFAPAVSWGIVPDERLALARFGGGSCCFNGEAIVHSVEVDAVNLSLVKAGRCPLLLEHCLSIDSLLGRVETVRHVDGHMEAIVRFARGGQADHVWNLLAQAFPLSLSIGASVERAMQTPDGRYVATNWRLRELSVCIFGKDERAELTILSDTAAAAWFQNKAASAEDRHAAVRDRLRSDKWAEWALWRGGPRLAERFGVELVDFGIALQEEVERHAAELEAALLS